MQKDAGVSMASWIFHLRAAEAVLETFPDAPRTESEICHWYMGNLAPDCGIPVGFAEYVPSKDVTHFKVGKHPCPARFAEAYLTGDRSCDPETLWFLQGYHAHLLTDVFWVENVLNPEKERFAPLHERDRKAFYALVKADWYDLDTLWLGELYAAGETFRPLEMLMKLSDFPNRCLDFFPADAFTLRLHSLRELYAPDVILPQLAGVRRDYPVLTPEEEASLLSDLIDSISSF